MRSTSRCRFSSTSRIEPIRPSAPSQGRFSGSQGDDLYRHCSAGAACVSFTQDRRTGNYEVGSKLVVLGEAARGRFDIVRAGRDELIALARQRNRRPPSGAGAGLAVVLDLIQGHTVIEFGTRPRKRRLVAAMKASHGKVWLAFFLQARRRGGLCREPRRHPVLEIAKFRLRGLATVSHRCSSDCVNAWRRRSFDHAHALSDRSLSSSNPFISRPIPSYLHFEVLLRLRRFTHLARSRCLTYNTIFFRFRRSGDRFAAENASRDKPIAIPIAGGGYRRPLQLMSGCAT